MRKEFEKNGLYNPTFETDNCGVGFIINRQGNKTHALIEQGLEMLINMNHRGAVGYDDRTGDGAGLKIQIDQEYFKSQIPQLENKERFAVGMLFFPMEPNIRFKCMALIEEIINSYEIDFIQWRNVPIDETYAGSYARNTLPEIQQLFIDPCDLDQQAFQRILYLVRKKIEQSIAAIDSEYTNDFYICSLSEETIIYKGLLLARQIGHFYKDLTSVLMKTSYVIVHQRFSTNTSPSWKLAHPFKYIAHNGEINTIQGNIRKFESKKEMLASTYFGKKLTTLDNIIEKNVSDSANLDNIIELLTLNGRNIFHSLAMVMPEAWENNDQLDQKVKSFYQYNSHLIEPWDGPATILFSDQDYIGAKLDRNGLRPARYYVTEEQVILASEAGVVQTKEEAILLRGKIKPGQFFAVDIKTGRLIRHDEILDNLADSIYLETMENNALDYQDQLIEEKKMSDERFMKKLQEHGYNQKEIETIIFPMGRTGEEVITSMGDDRPIAILSEQPKLLFDYFKQLFAQVTNPAIDPIREKNVMSLKVNLGQFNGLLNGIETDTTTQFIECDHPIIDNKTLAELKTMHHKAFRSIKIPLIFDSEKLGTGLAIGLELLCQRVKKAIMNDYNLIILSDRDSDQFKSSIPSLLAIGAVNTYLLENKLKSKVDIVMETADARNPMHMALLFGYGASLVNPYLALDLIEKSEFITSNNDQLSQKKYIEGLEKGLLKILSKMGISTLNSYVGAQMFETIGLNASLINQFFKATPNRIEGVDLDIIAKEIYQRHENAYFSENQSQDSMKIIKSAEEHPLNPSVIKALQKATMNNNYNDYKKFAHKIDHQGNQLFTLRGLMKFQSDREPIAIEAVEPIDQIVKRFVSGAMSFGSLSQEVHECISEGMNTLGGKSNSGEGGEDSNRYRTHKRSKIKQIAAGRFGVTVEYLNDADEIQIKVAQGAKPGEGGHLPGDKVVGAIAKVRRAIPHLQLISPPPHHDIYSIEDLEQLIYDLKSVNPSAKISVKLVSRAGIGTIASGVAKGHADMILVSGHDGGTGAAPVSSLQNAGVPWELGLSETHQSLLLNNLRDKVSLRVDGQMRTGRDVIIATLLGAEEFAFSTSILITLGCIMCRQCHTNKCPKGITTQDQKLRKKFQGKPDHVVNYFNFIAKEVREYLASLGYESIDQLIGRADLLKKDNTINHWKINKIDLSKILYKPTLPQSFGSRFNGKNYLIKYGVLDDQILKDIQFNRPLTYEINNTNRTVGAKLSHKIYQSNDDPLTIDFYGTAGQSFGAFLSHNIQLRLKGDANDYVGKGLSGGEIIINTPHEDLKENLLIGNTALYGATSGKLYVNGTVGERFAIRNSGAIAIVEGLGNHGCEYMTNGIVIVLGAIGDNFGAGMSGGLSYIYNDGDKNLDQINQTLVTVKALTDHDEENLKILIKDFYYETQSKKAKKILEQWSKEKRKFIKVSNPKYDQLIIDQDVNNKMSIKIK